MKHRKILQAKIRTNIHLKKKKGGGHKLTPAERKVRQEKRDNKRSARDSRLAKARAKIWKEAQDIAAELGNTPDYWHQTLMQNARIAKRGRAPSRWNAFVSIYVDEDNESE